MPATERGGQTPAQRPTSPLTNRARAFIDGRRELHAEAVQAAPDSHLEIGHRWSAQRYLGYFRYS